MVGMKILKVFSVANKGLVEFQNYWCLLENMEHASALVDASTPVIYNHITPSPLLTHQPTS